MRNANDMPVWTGMKHMQEHSASRAARSLPAVRGKRVRDRQIAWITDRLTDRDWQVVETVNQLRIVSGNQLERLIFSPLQGHAREVVRGRVLHRLVQWQVLDALPRRVGGMAHGSGGSVFVLGTAGARLVAERQAATTPRPRVRHPGVPTERTVRHTLAVSELYTALVEETRAVHVRVLSFQAEPACWWPNGLGGYLKPDAYTLLASGDIREHWWVEVDLATESLPTLKRKLSAYLEFVARGQLGPGQLVPRVLVSVISAARLAAVETIVEQLPAPARDLFMVRLQTEAASALLQSLQE